jgi:ankyrin repeat protein
MTNLAIPKIIADDMRNINVRRKLPVTPMSTAIKCASRNDVASLQKLLDSGTNLKESTFDDESILHVAALRGSLDVVKFCIDQKLDVNGKTRYFEVLF